MQKLLILLCTLCIGCVPQLLTRALDSSYKHMTPIVGQSYLECINGECTGNCVAYTLYHRKFLSDHSEIYKYKLVIVWTENKIKHMILEVDTIEDGIWYLDNRYKWPMRREELINKGYIFR